MHISFSLFFIKSKNYKLNHCKSGTIGIPKKDNPDVSISRKTQPLKTEYEEVRSLNRPVSSKEMESVKPFNNNENTQKQIALLVHSSKHLKKN